MSNFARSTLAKNLFAHHDLHSDPKVAMESAYRSTQAEIERLHGQEATRSWAVAVG